MGAIPDRVDLSPNFNNFPPLASTRTVIIHATRSGVSQNPTEFEGTLNYMRKPGTTSSNWVISRAGVKCRVVNDDKQAWHAAEDNDNSWGIELEQGAEQDGFTDLQMEALADVCRGYMADFGVPPVHAKTSQQPGFIGHQETAQGKSYGKSDPGNRFDWDRFLASLQPEEEGIAEMKWVALENRPEDKQFRSYLIWADAAGLKSRFVPNFEEHQALEESGVAGPLQFVSIQTLRQFKCTPDALS